MLDLENIKSQTVTQFGPTNIVLLGSQAKGTTKANRGIDLCIVAQTTDKRRRLTNMHCQIEADTPIDFLLYTPEEWSRCISDKQSFAHKINCEGVRLYG